MHERIEQELVLLRGRYPALEYRPNGHWILIPAYALPAGWSRAATDVALQIPIGYPGTPPYGFYVLAGLTVNGTRPDNYVEPAPAQPPFGNSWGMFSWTLGDGEWRPTTNPTTGVNLLNWVIGFGLRFREGK